jgi:hypothetical protein
LVELDLVQAPSFHWRVEANWTSAVGSCIVLPLRFRSSFPVVFLCFVFWCVLPCDDFKADVRNTSTPQEMEIWNLPKDFDVSHVKARAGRDATEMPMLRVDFRWKNGRIFRVSKSKRVLSLKKIILYH